MSHQNQSIESDKNDDAPREQVTPRRTARGLLALRLVLSLTALCLAALAVEFSFAWLDLFQPTPRTYVGQFENQIRENWIADAATGWKMRPHQHFIWHIEDTPIDYYSDESGYRVGTRNSSAKEAFRHIVVAGDSFMFGMNVEYEKTVAGLLDSQLADCRVTNLAMPGYGVDQIWTSIRDCGLLLHPDLIVVGLYAADFDRCFDVYRPTEGFNKPAFKIHEGDLVQKTRADTPNPLLRWIERHSRLYRIGMGCGRRLGKRGIGVWWTLNEAILDSLRKDCARHQATVLFVHIPERDDWADFPALNAFMQEHECSYIDLAVALQPWHNEIYFDKSTGDDHFNDIGHRRLAEQILDWIERHMPDLK